MKVVIIEDEKLSADYLSTLLLRIDPSIEVIQTIDSVKKSIEYLQKGCLADLLFVDIHLADGISFEIFQTINVDIPIVFTTAYDAYAIQAFKLNSIDYLLKPINKEELQQALSKFKKTQTIQQQAININYENIFNELNKVSKSRFLVKIGDQLLPIKTEDVALFKSENGMVYLVNHAQKEYPIDYSLDQLEQLLDHRQFFRINRKVIIAVQSIEKVASFFNSRLKIKHPNLDEEMGIVSRERVSDFKKWLEG
jgi:DNA-binding LytR/AlgR family response regulator